MNRPTTRALSAPSPATSARIVIAGGLVALLVLTLAATASHAAAFRFWSYWQGGTGTWEAAMIGAGEYELVDKDVQGWRFAITSDAPATPPDNAPDFATLCPDLSQPVTGSVRVAVVLDFGFAADAPQGQTPPADEIACLTLPAGSTGNQALAQAGSITDNAGMVCAVNGYPTDECGAEVSDADAAAAAQAAAKETPNPAVPGDQASSEEKSTSVSPMAWLLAGVVSLALGLLVMRGRRRPGTER